MMTKCGARVGAAVFALGLWTAGPQSLAVADDTVTDTSSVADAATSSRSAARPSRPVSPAAGVRARRQAAASAERQPLTAASDAGRPVAVVAVPKSSPVPVPVASLVKIGRAVQREFPAAAARRSVRSAAVAARPVLTVPVGSVVPLSPVAAVVAAPANPLHAINTAVAGFFDGAQNRLSTLPAGPVSDLLSGALLLIRRNLFDQVPTAAPVQTTPYRSNGDIRGYLRAADAEGDPLTYEVIDTPEYGSVVVDAQGQYTYTPGPDFAGSLTPDGFTVRITDSNGGFNLLDPFGDRSTDVVVAAPDLTTPFFEGNNDDLTIVLEDTVARVDVVKQNGKLLGTVSLALPDETVLRWMDAKGQTGSVSVAEVASDWSKITDAGSVQLGITYAAGDGTEYTVILDSVQVAVTDAGVRAFSGELADLAPQGAVNDPGEAGIDSYLDVLGGSYGVQYETFRASVAGLDSFGLDVAGANVFLHTWSVQDWQAEVAGANLGVTSDTIPGLASAGAKATSGNVVNATSGNVVNGWSLDVQTLKDALAYSKACGQVSNTCLEQNFNAGYVSTYDPIFGAIDNFVPSCGPALSCTGTFYLADASSAGKLYSLANASLALGSQSQSLDVSLDLGGTAYGYIYVPDGPIDKLYASKYAAGMFLSVTTGPSFTLNLGDGNGTFNLASRDLVNLTPFYNVTPYGTISVSTTVNASLDATLLLPPDFTGNQLDGSIYATGGVVMGFNTGGAEGFQWGGSAYYVDTDFSDFDVVSGITLSPTITPSVTASWGLFTPANTPLVGQISFLDVSLGYSNPLSANLTWSAVSDPAITFTSSGSLDFSAGLVPSITDALTYSQSFELYRYTTDNVLA